MRNIIEILRRTPQPAQAEVPGQLPADGIKGSTPLESGVDQDLAPADNPYSRRILLGDHALKFYPGFEEFAAAWNGHIEDEGRSELAAAAWGLEREIDIEDHDDAIIQQRQTVATATEMLDGERNLSHDEQKRLRRDRRRANQRIQRHEVVPQAKRRQLAELKARLRTSDVDFVVGAETRDPSIFYALEFDLAQDEVDEVFIKRVQDDPVGAYYELLSLNFFYRSLGNYKYDKFLGEGETGDPAARVDATRQHAKMNMEHARSLSRTWNNTP